MSKFKAFAVKAVAFARSGAGKRDIALVFSSVVSLYEAAHKAGLV